MLIENNLRFLRQRSFNSRYQCTIKCTKLCPLYSHSSSVYLIYSLYRCNNVQYINSSEPVGMICLNTAHRWVHGHVFSVAVHRKWVRNYEKIDVYAFSGNFLIQEILLWDFLFLEICTVQEGDCSIVRRFFSLKVMFLSLT